MQQEIAANALAPLGAALINSQSAFGELTLTVARDSIVGVLTAHMFVVGREVYVHELIPRPGTLGIYTLDSARTNQYEQQLRAVCGLGLGAPTMTVPGIAVASLPRELWAEGEPKWERLLSEGSVHLHLYQLNGHDAMEAGDGVIMGHLAATSGTAAGSTSVVRRMRKQLTTG